MTAERLRAAVERLAAMDAPSASEVAPVVESFLAALEAGAIRAAERDGDGWRLNAWVKAGILLAFRATPNADVRSRKRFPSASHTFTPSARCQKTGKSSARNVTFRDSCRRSFSASTRERGPGMAVRS